LVHFFLIVQGILSGKHEFTDFSLDLLWQFHVFHICIHHIDLLLKLLRFSIHVLENAGNRTKNIGVHECTRDQTDDAGPYHPNVRWRDVVATELKNSVVN